MEEAEPILLEGKRVGKIAFVFSGQGDQSPGMGKRPVWKNIRLLKKIFDLCDDIRPGTSSQCFHGTEEELKETKNTQPCLLQWSLRRQLF